MRTRTIISSLIIFFFTINCNGQDEKKSNLANKTIHNTSNAKAFTDNFSKIEKFYYDSEDKIVFSTKLFLNSGKYTIYYTPKSSENIEYFKNFEILNKITPLFDELNSQHYYSDSDQEKINQILRKKIKNEKDFFIFGTFIDQKYINIKNDDEYSVQYPYVVKFYQKKENKWSYLFDKKIESYEDEVKHNSLFNYDSIIANNPTISNSIDTNAINGIWKVNCKNGIGSLYINNKNAVLVVLFNQIYIDLIEIKKYEYEKGIAYRLKKIPEDNGNFGKTLPWKDYLNDKVIAYVKVIDENTINFYWYGFYNSKANKREFKDINFRQETNEKDVILNKCVD